MIIPRQTRKIKEGIRPGYRDVDSHALDNSLDHPTAVREAQLIDDYKDENVKRNICALCGSDMQFFEESEKLVCTYVRCGATVDVINNAPLTSTDQSMHPFSSQHYDPNIEDDEPFFASWSPDSQFQEEKDYQVTYSSSDGRVKKIRCNGFPGDISINAFND